jgi:hypothetical protein
MMDMMRTYHTSDDFEQLRKGNTLIPIEAHMIDRKEFRT